MPPIRFGMKNTERNSVEPLMALVSMYAMANATTLITTVVTIVNRTVQELRIRDYVLVVRHAHERGVSDRAELAERQVHAHGERHQETNDESRERG